MKKSNSMYVIRKYANAWVIHNDDTREERPLTEPEIKMVQEEFPTLQDPKTRSVFADNIQSLGISSPPVRPRRGKKRRMR